VDGRAHGVVVSFQVDGRSYALPLEQVLEVVRMVAITPVPDAPAWLAGVVNLRGRLIPMIDLRPRFGAPATEPDPSHVFIVAESRGRTAGVLADRVEDVVEAADAGTAGFVVLDLDKLLEGMGDGDWRERGALLAVGGRTQVESTEDSPAAGRS
jgi:hypothetical protein